MNNFSMSGYLLDDVDGGQDLESNLDRQGGKMVLYPLSRIAQPHNIFGLYSYGFMDTRFHGIIFGELRW